MGEEEVLMKRTVGVMAKRNSLRASQLPPLSPLSGSWGRGGLTRTEEVVGPGDKRESLRQGAEAVSMQRSHS